MSSRYAYVPDRRAEYCDDHVCVSVCPGVYLRKYMSDLHQFFVHVTYSRGSVLLWQSSDMLRTSGFMDDVILAHKPRQFNVVRCFVNQARL